MHDLQPGRAQIFKGHSLEMAYLENVGLHRINDDGTLWGTRGRQLLRLDPQAEAFRYVESLPTRDLTGHLMRWPRMRKRLRLDDFVAVRWLKSGTRIARIGGWLFRSAEGKAFKPVHRLRHFGHKTGRGVGNHGMLETSSGRLIYGEYFRNTTRGPVRLYASDDDGQSWQVLYEFPAGDIRHVHCIVEDPYTGNLFVMTGDYDQESRILESADGCKSFRLIGTGSQSWRTCDLLFMPDALLWAVDSGRAGFPGIWRWDRQTASAERIFELDGAVEYCMLIREDLCLFTVCRNNFECEWDRNPSFWVIRYNGQSQRLALDMVRGPKAVQTGLRLVASPSKEWIGLTVTNTDRYPFASFWTRSERFAELLT